MMQEKLTLNDGTELAGHVIEDGMNLFVYLDNNTILAAFPILSDPEKTENIVAFRNGQTTEYTGYTHLKSISEENGGRVSAVLLKEVNG